MRECARDEPRRAGAAGAYREVAPGRVAAERMRPGARRFGTCMNTTSFFVPRAAAMRRRTARRSARGIISAEFTPGSCAAAAPHPSACASSSGYDRTARRS
jgi:hypothetical protein